MEIKQGLIVTLHDFLITSLRTHLGPDKTRWREFLSDYLNTNAGDIDDYLAGDDEDSDEEGWPVCADCGREIDLQEGPLCDECRQAEGGETDES
jgi:hypothetical protein